MSEIPPLESENEVAASSSWGGKLCVHVAVILKGAGNQHVHGCVGLGVLGVGITNYAVGYRRIQASMQCWQSSFWQYTQAFFGADGTTVRDTHELVAYSPNKPQKLKVKLSNSY